MNDISIGLSSLGCSDEVEEKVTYLVSLRKIQIVVYRIYVSLYIGAYQRSA